MISYDEFYSQAINNLTLREALQIHYKINPKFTVWDKYKSPYARNLIKAHDISHIISGCDTKLKGEILVQVWTLCCAKIVTDDFWKYYRDPESQVLLRPVGLPKMILTGLMSSFDIILIWLRSWRMHKKWRYFEEEKWMNHTIGEIRQKFGIVLKK